MYVLADSSFRGLSLDDVKISILPPQDGWENLARAVRRRCVDISKFRKLYICLGRADVADGLSEVSGKLQDLFDSIRRFNTNAEIIMTGPVPRGLDSRRLVAKCVLAGRVVKSFCAGSQRCHFSEVAAHFYNRRGINVTFLLPEGATALGRAAIKSDIKLFL